MEFPVMLYRCPGPNQCQGGSFSHVAAVDQAEFDQRIADGWHASVPDALAPPPKPEPLPVADDAAPTRAELEAKAAELGIEVDGRWGDAKIAKLIADTLARA